jgi:hypothetical protein
LSKAGSCQQQATKKKNQFDSEYSQPGHFIKIFGTKIVI